MKLVTHTLRTAFAVPGLFLLALLLGTSVAPMAQTTLNPGDIAVIGFNGDNPDSFALLATVDIAVGTEINITDKGVDAAGNFLADGEAQRTFTTVGGISAGDVLVVNRADSGETQMYPAALGTPNSSSFGLSLQSSGDQIIVWQGASDAPRFIYAFSTTPFDANFDADNTADTTDEKDNFTAVPPGLTNGTTAIDFDPEVDNHEYDRTNGTSGSRSTLLALVSNDANYNSSDSDRFELQSGAFTVFPVAPIALPITFEESIDYSLNDFGGTMSMLAADPSGAPNTVVQTLRPATAECYAGTTVAESSVAFAEPIPFTADATTMSVRVWSPEAGVLVLFKVEEQGNPGLNVETYSYTTVAGGWETMVFDFSDPKPNTNPLQIGANYNKASIFFDFQCNNVPPTTLTTAMDRTYYWDDVAFGSGANMAAGQDLVVTGVIDGPLSGGVPKAVEFYVVNDIADLSVYGFGSANNADGSNGIEFVFPTGPAAAGTFLYLASEEPGFTSFFGMAPTYTSGAASINGDDSVELFYDPNGTAEAAAADLPSTTSVVDVFGVVGTDGTDQPWEYLDGWAYRTDGTGPDGSTFDIGNWSFSGINALDGETTNATATTPFPIGSYSATPPVNPVVSFTSSSAEGDEGDTVTLTVQIDYADGSTAMGDVVVDVTYASGSAVAADFTGPTPAQVTFTGGMDATQDVSFVLTADDGFEGAEDATFSLAIASGTADLGTPSSATITITDGDEAPVSTFAAARAAGVGQTVRVQGTVTRAQGNLVYFQDGTAGLALYQPSGEIFDAVAAGTIAPGSQLDVTGTLSQFNGLLQISGNDLTSYQVTGTTDVPEAQVVTLAMIAAAGESYESELVRVENVTFAEAGNGQFAARTTYQLTDASDATNAVAVRIPNAGDTEVDGVDIPGNLANVTGVVGQFDGTEPRDEGYQIQPIAADDVQFVTGVDNEGGVSAEATLNSVNPLRGSATVRFSLGTPGQATVALYDALGRQVAVVAEGTFDTSLQTASINAGSLASGVYVLRLQGETESMTQTVTVVR